MQISKKAEEHIKTIISFYTKKLGQIADQCRSMINGEVTRYESKQCKVDNCDHKNKRVPIDQKFCAGCGRSYG